MNLSKQAKPIVGAIRILIKKITLRRWSACIIRLAKRKNGKVPGKAW